MKKLLVTIGLIVIAIPAILAQEQPAPKDTAEITFEKKVYELGNIKPGSHTFEFVFNNTGKGVLTLNNVSPGCGCTKVEWTKEPIKPGEKGIIKTTYSATAIGHFSKPITVFSNAKTPTVTITFNANVTNPAETTQTTADSNK